MPCYKPLTAYAAPGGISFDHTKSFGYTVELPCGRCLGCQLEKSKQWALRCTHEAQTNEGNNCFITLTYNDDHLPEGGSLVKTHYQKFIRALRKKTKQKIRYYMCGEYGEKNNRPHYHAILFGYQFPDITLANVRKGNRVYRSNLLEEIWYHGTSEIGSVTFQSAGYVARYLLKKQIKDHKLIVCNDTGEITGTRLNEYTAMSLKPGIGKSWYDKNKADLFPHDYAITPDGRKMPVPRYYRDLLEKDDPKLYELLKIRRIEKAKSCPDNSPERLAVREKVHSLKAEKLLREL